MRQSQILFFEDIKEDGRVMQAIREYQKNPPKPADNTNTQQTPATTPTTQTPKK